MSAWLDKLKKLFSRKKPNENSVSKQDKEQIKDEVE